MIRNGTSGIVPEAGLPWLAPAGQGNSAELCKVARLQACETSGLQEFGGGSMSSTILIADDDPVQRRLLEAMVRRFGYHVRVADGGEAALRELEAGRVYLVILDLVMPDLDGMGVLGRMRAGGIEVPVIVQTAHGSIDAVVSA